MEGLQLKSLLDSFAGNRVRALLELCRPPDRQAAFAHASGADLPDDMKVAPAGSWAA